MIRVTLIGALAFTVMLGCSKDLEVPQAIAIATTTVEKADQEVLVASNPAGARVLLKGAEVGATPMKLLIRGDTNIVLEKEGYVQQALLITSKSDPNVIVDLVAFGDGLPQESAVVEQVAEIDSKQEAASVKLKSSKKIKAKSEKKDPVVATIAPKPKPNPEPVKASYNNMRKLKEAFKAGRITKIEYKKYQQEIRRKRSSEYNATKGKLRSGLITKAEYNKLIKDIRVKFEG